MSRHNRRRAEAAQHTEKRAPEHTRSALQLRTPENVVHEQTIKQLALRIWTALVGEMVSSGMSALIDELLESRLLDDDDDEEGDNESWLDDRHSVSAKF